MSHGFLVNNNSNQILVSDQTLNLHFVGKYTSPSKYIKNLTTTQAGGGINIVNYRITCTAVPMPFFTAPNNSEFYAVSRIAQVDYQSWDIEVTKSGANGDYPELYIFAEAKACASTGDTHGVVVYRNGVTKEVSFDSRLRPLTITHSLNLLHPNLPRDSVSTAGLSARYIQTWTASGSNFAPQNSNQYNLSIPTSNKPIFFFASLAQAEMQTPTLYDKDERKRGIGIVDFYVEYDEYWAVMWTIYRGAIRATSNTQISAGWVSIDCGYTRKVQEKQINIFGYSGFNFSDGTWTESGVPAWTNKSINVGTGTSLIIGNAERYD